MYIDKIYNKLFSDKNWDGIETLRAEVRSFTRGIEQYKEYFEPGYNHLKNYRNKTSEILQKMRKSPDYNPNYAFDYMKVAHDEASRDPDIEKSREAVTDAAFNELRNRYRNSGKDGEKFWDFVKRDMHEGVDEMENEGLPRSKTKLGPHTFRNMYRNDEDYYSGADDWENNYAATTDPYVAARRWNERKERNYEDDTKKNTENRDAALKKASEDFDKSLPEPNAWNKITGKYGKAKKAASEQYDKDVQSAWNNWTEANKKADKDRSNKAGTHSLDEAKAIIGKK